ncbi:hypothetical protein C8R44DRAFT_601387 [Mycena epipterygia]|nr:hypothetical protein C8R44DRAFT_601387 [Mycena epipterygia]
MSNDSWSSIKSRIRKNIRAAFNLNASIDLDDYKVSFTIPRHVKDPIVLNDSTKYDLLLSNALKIKTHPAVKIIVEPKTVRRPVPPSADKENEDKTKGKKAVKKTKVPNARDILPGNVALNDKIAAIREKWKCPTQGGRCGSEHCFVHPDEPDHFPLSQAHCESWGAAMLKGEEFATINKPPNNELFDKLDPRGLAARSPLLQRRLELNQQKAAAANPQININFPPELVGLFGRPAAPDPVGAPVLLPRVAPPHPDVPMLISPGIAAGPSLSVEDFCTRYDLDDDICARFKQFKYKKTDSFRYITLHQLEKMEFMPGEVAELQVAIAKWTVPAA